MTRERGGERRERGRPGPWIVAGPIALVAAWAIAAALKWPSARAVPSPVDVAALARDELFAGALWRDVLATVARAVTGVALATAAGVAIGVAVGRTPRARRAAEPTIDFFRAIPPLLVFPVLLLGFGYGDRARVAAVTFGTCGIVAVHVAAALAFRLLYGPELLPGLLTGVRIALAQGLVIATATEMLLGARRGLGARALQAQLTYRTDQLWLVVLVAGAVGLALSAAVAALERRVDNARLGA